MADALSILQETEENNSYHSKNSCNYNQNINIQVQHQNNSIHPKIKQDDSQKKKRMDPSPTASPEITKISSHHLPYHHHGRLLSRGDLIPNPPLVAGVGGGGQDGSSQQHDGITQSSNSHDVTCDQNMTAMKSINEVHADNHTTKMNGGMDPGIGSISEQGMDSSLSNRLHNPTNTTAALTTTTTTSAAAAGIPSSRMSRRNTHHNHHRPRVNNLARKLETTRTPANSNRRNTSYTAVTLLSEEEITKDDLQAMKDMIGDIKKDPSLLFRLSTLPGNNNSVDEEDEDHHNQQQHDQDTNASPLTLGGGAGGGGGALPPPSSAATGLLKQSSYLDDDQTDVSSLGMMSSGDYYSNHLLPGPFPHPSFPYPYPMQQANGNSNNIANNNNHLSNGYNANHHIYPRRYPSTSPSPQHVNGDYNNNNNSNNNMMSSNSSSNHPNAVAQRRTSHDAEIALRMQSLRAKRGLLTPSTPTTQMRLASRARSMGNIAAGEGTGGAGGIGGSSVGGGIGGGLLGSGANRMGKAPISVSSPDVAYSSTGRPSTSENEPMASSEVKDEKKLESNGGDIGGDEKKDNDFSPKVEKEEALVVLDSDDGPIPAASAAATATDVVVSAKSPTPVVSPTAEDITISPTKESSVSEHGSEYSNYPLGETAARAVAAMVAIAQEDRKSPRNYRSGISKYDRERNASAGRNREGRAANSAAEGSHASPKSRPRSGSGASWKQNRGTEGRMDERSASAARSVTMEGARSPRRDQRRKTEGGNYPERSSSRQLREEKPKSPGWNQRRQTEGVIDERSSIRKSREENPDSSSWKQRRQTEGGLDVRSSSRRAKDESEKQAALSKSTSKRRLTEGNVDDRQKKDREGSSSKASSSRHTKHSSRKSSNKEGHKEGHKERHSHSSKHHSSRRLKEGDASEKISPGEVRKDKSRHSSRTSSRPRPKEDSRRPKPGELDELGAGNEAIREKERDKKESRRSKENESDERSVKSKVRIREKEHRSSHRSSRSSSSTQDFDETAANNTRHRCSKSEGEKLEIMEEEHDQSDDKQSVSEHTKSSHHHRRRTMDSEKHDNRRSKGNKEPSRLFNNSSPQLGEFIAPKSPKSKRSGSVATIGGLRREDVDHAVDDDEQLRSEEKNHSSEQLESSIHKEGGDKNRFSDNSLPDKQNPQDDRKEGNGSSILHVHSVESSSAMDHDHNKSTVSFSEEFPEPVHRDSGDGGDLHLLQRKSTNDSVSHYEGSHAGSSHGGRSVMSRLRRKKNKNSSKKPKDLVHPNLDTQSSVSMLSSEFDNDSPKKSTGSDDSGNHHHHSQKGKGLISRLSNFGAGMPSPGHQVRRQSLNRGDEAASSSIAASSDKQSKVKSAGNPGGLNDSATYLLNDEDDAMAMSREFAALTGEVPRLCDERGRCALHPHIRLQKPKLFGGWKIMFKHCPDCAVEHMKRSQKELAKLQVKQREKQRKLKELREERARAALKELREEKERAALEKQREEEALAAFEKQKEDKVRAGLTELEEEERIAPQNDRRDEKARAAHREESKNERKQPISNVDDSNMTEDFDDRHESKPKDSSHDGRHKSSASNEKDASEEKDAEDQQNDVRKPEAKDRGDTKDDFVDKPYNKPSEPEQPKPPPENKKPKPKKVNGLPWSDYNGQSGRYTGEVNDQYLPHGKGEMVYDRGVITAGFWFNGVLDTEAPVTEEQYVPDRLTHYSVGDKGREEDMIIESKRVTSMAVSTIRVNDGAFVRRSDGSWTYAVVKDRTDGDNPTIRFKVNARGSTKAFPMSQWGTYVRRVKRRADAPAPKAPAQTLDDFLQNNRSKIGSSNSVHGNLLSNFSDSASVSSAHSAPMMNRNHFMGNLTTGKMKIRTRSRSRSRSRKNVTTLPLLFSSSMSVSEETEGQDNDDWETASGSGYRLRGIDP